MEYIVFWVTRKGIWLINKKVEAIVNTTPTKNTREGCEFVGLLKYYRDMWVRRSHLLHQWTEITSPKVKFKWTDVEQKAFDDIKRTVTHDTLLEYPDLNKRFDIHTDSRDNQLVSVIIQDGKPINFYIRKLTETQTWYTVMEK